MFRYPEHRALINRLGFNNDGARRGRRAAAALARNGAVDAPPLFVNVGKNRDVPLDRAADAYAQCYMRVARWADGVVLNLSSPNTPNAARPAAPRASRDAADARPSVRDEMPFARGQHPILIKIAPDLDASQLAEICDVCDEARRRHDLHEHDDRAAVRDERSGRTLRERR